MLICIENKLRVPIVQSRNIFTYHSLRTTCSKSSYYILVQKLFRLTYFCDWTQQSPLLL